MAADRIHFITPVNAVHVEDSGDTGWVDLDLSAHVPEGAAGVLLQLSLRTYEHDTLLEVRKKGYAGTLTSRVETTHAHKWIHNFVIVGCDENGVIQYRISGQGPEEDACYDIDLFGYLAANGTAGGQIYFINPVVVLHLQDSGNIFWTTLNLSGHLPDGSTGALLGLYAFHVEEGARLRVRKDGYTGAVTQRVETVRELRWISNFVIVACSEDKAIQYKLDEQGEAETASCYIYLWGYVM